jgi:hypothetical protein
LVYWHTKNHKIYSVFISFFSLAFICSIFLLNHLARKTNFASWMAFIITFLLFRGCCSLGSLDILLDNALLCRFLLLGFRRLLNLGFFLLHSLSITSFLMYYHYDCSLILLNILYFKYANFQLKTNI